jgi:hypothetical protein
MHDDDTPLPGRERHGLDGDIQKNCEHCRFFSGGSESGECRRHAPAPPNTRHDRRSHVDDDTVGFSAWWPSVDSSDWCGEFEPIDGINW